MKLRHGCNAPQGFAEALEGSPVQLRNGAASMINPLDALNAWQLSHEGVGGYDERWNDGVLRELRGPRAVARASRSPPALPGRAGS